MTITNLAKIETLALLAKIQIQIKKQLNTCLKSLAAIKNKNSDKAVFLKDKAQILSDIHYFITEILSFDSNENYKVNHIKIYLKILKNNKNSLVDIRQALTEPLQIQLHKMRVQIISILISKLENILFKPLKNSILKKQTYKSNTQNWVNITSNEILKGFPSKETFSSSYNFPKLLTTDFKKPSLSDTWIPIPYFDYYFINQVGIVKFIKKDKNQICTSQTYLTKLPTITLVCRKRNLQYFVHEILNICFGKNVANRYIKKHTPNQIKFLQNKVLFLT